MRNRQKDGLGRVGSVLDERCDDEFVAVAGGDVERRVPALVLAVNLRSCTTAAATGATATQTHSVREAVVTQTSGRIACDVQTQ